MLDLSEFINVKVVNIDGGKYDDSILNKLILGKKPELNEIRCCKSQLTSVDLSGCQNLERIEFSEGQLTSVDFLNTLPNPEKLKELSIYDNNIQPTTLDF